MSKVNSHSGANAGTLKYNKKVSRYPSDYASYHIDDVEDVLNKPITLINQLPVNVIITLEKVFKDPIEIDPIIPMGTIFAQKQLNVPRDGIDDGDLFHFQYINEKGKLQFVCPSCDITKRHGAIRIGTIFSYPSYKRDIHPGGDVSSISVHNLLPWSIVLSRNMPVDNPGTTAIKPVIYVEANQNLGDPYTHGNLTIAPTVHYDNDNYGLNLGTQFNVSANIPTLSGNKLIPLYTFVLNDIDENQIFIGGVSPIIGLSVVTGASKSIAKKTHTGRAIYRFGEDVPLEDIPPEGIGIRAKNAKGTDMKRVTFNSTRTSTNPIARHPKLSGKNVMNGVYL